MQLNLTVWRNVVIAGLLIILGGMLQYRYGFVYRIPGVDSEGARSGSAYPSGEKAQLVNTEQPSDKKDVNFAAFWQAWNYLEEDYLETENIQTEKMVNGAIAGMTSSLGDPYTMYLPPADLQRSGEDLAGAFFGVGIELGYINNTLAVVTPLKGSPAEVAGVKAGDLILRVKDTAKNLESETAGWTLVEAVDHIRGKRGTDVTLTLYREEKAKEPFDVTIKRDEIIVSSVEISFPEQNGKKVAHLKLMRFGERTESEWNKAVDDILKQKGSISGVVLDMRNNPGGFFDESITIASEFIDKGTIVTQKGRTNQQDFPARGKARLVGIPVEVLVNKGSASASEIVAGALRDQLGAKLIGEKTFGKGTVQDRRELSNGGGMHITIGRWLLPKGDWIHKEGIPVDVEVKDDPETEQDEVLLKAIEII